MLMGAMRPQEPNSQENGRGAPSIIEDQLGRGPLRVVARTLYKAWYDKIFSEAASAAFWETLSLPPLLLGFLGSLGFVSHWFGPAVVDAVHSKILSFSRTVFTPGVVDGIIAPTVQDILTRGHSEVVSTGFVLSLWAGSSALASLVDSITIAYNQYMVRPSVWQRLFALLLYLIGLILAVVVLPVIALGPDLFPTFFPTHLQGYVRTFVQVFYYPATAILLVLALTTLYKVALPRKLPWHRGLPGALLALVIFVCASIGVRLYFGWVTSTGYTYGALATPIVFLLFAFFIGLAIIMGAHFNNAIQETWPATMTRRERRRWRRLEMTRADQRLRTEAGYEAWRNGRRQASTAEDAEANGPATPPASSTSDLPKPRNGTQPPVAGGTPRERRPGSR